MSIQYIDTKPWPVHVGFTSDPKRWDKEMKRMKVSEPFTNSPGCTTTFGKEVHSDDCYNRLIIVTTNAKSRKLDDVVPVLSHEAVHVVQRIWEYVGEEMPGYEQEAYLVQWLVQEFIRIYKDEKQPGRVSKLRGSSGQRVRPVDTTESLLLYKVHGRLRSNATKRI